ncbi:MAG: hypothetical protein DRI36_05105 [Caldiserica bacterium]|nr:MAG: hypothetical protein DRI36_05105 [Caldisericota bacterium]
MKKRVLFIASGERDYSIFNFLFERKDMECRAVVLKDREGRFAKDLRKKNIDVLDDYRDLKNLDEIDVVVDLTGSEEVRNYFKSFDKEILGRVSTEILLELLRERRIYYELEKFTSKLDPSLGLEELLVILIGSTLKILKADSAGVFLNVNGRIESKTSWGMSDTEIENFINFLEKEKFSFKDTEIMEERGFLCTSYKTSDGDIFGYLVVGKNKPFTEEDKKLLLQLRDKSSSPILAAFKIKSTVEISLLDSLTGLYNHRAFQERLSKELERAYKYDLIFSLIMMDIDDFKKYNDTYGHLEGDHLLRSLAQIMKYTLRETDFIARYGGEEFAIILPETNKEGAVIACERLRRTIEGQRFGKERRKVTASFGVSSYPEDGVYKDDLIKKADDALYRSKRAGKNRVTPA